LPALVQALDKEWSDGGGLRWWTERHESLMAATSRLHELESAHATDALDPPALYEYAVLSAELRPDLDPMALFERAHTADPEAAGPAASVARRRLERNDASGLVLADAAWVRNPGVVESLAPAVLAYASRHALAGVEEQWRARCEAFVARRKYAELELTRLTNDDPMEPHTLDAREEALVVANCRSFNVRAGWIAQKHLSYQAECRVIVILVKPRWFRTVPMARLSRAIADSLESRERFAIVRADRTWKILLRRVRALDRSTLAI
jgi:hypothetical protein